MLCHQWSKIVADDDNLFGSVLGKNPQQSVYQFFTIHHHQWLGGFNPFLCKSRTLTGSYNRIFHFHPFSYGIAVTTSAGAGCKDSNPD